MKLKCIICKSPATDKHHIKTRGSGGTDDDFNLLNLCRNCHTRIHAEGIIKLMRENIELKIFLEDLGWEIKSIFGVDKLVRW